MPASKLRNLNIASFDPLPSPQEVREEIAVTDQAAETVLKGREAVRSILDGSDSRVFLVVGPCSIHDSKAALEYAERLKQLADQVADAFVIVMRTYFEKPRTTSGWKGFINDPFLDDSFRIDEGLRRARKLLLEINTIGVPVGTEALDPVCPQYLDDLITWNAIGARTVESQTHREMASGLSTPVGIKNGTDGNIDIMLNALTSVASPHHFLGIDFSGRSSVFRTAGNSYAHGVLRGGQTPNYDSVNVSLCAKRLAEKDLRSALMIDCSHGNSNKNHELQPLVFEDCIDQIARGCQVIRGLMIESNLFAGNQKLDRAGKDLQYGVSITDACIDWQTTEEIVLSAREALLAGR